MRSDTLLKSASSKQPNPDINVTPLVDVVLVLLIIFMVIAPALNDGATVQLPIVSTPDPKPKDMNPIKVTLAGDGTTVLNDQRIEAKDLRVQVEKLHEADPGRALMLLTDEKMHYKKVRETFAMLQGIGFKGILLKVTEKKTPGSS
jgi:biopolymer transport protein TolR